MKMNIKIKLNRLLTLGAAVVVLGMTPEAFAATDPAKVFTEGNVTCNDYASNKLINSINTSSPDLSGNPATLDDDDVEVTYTITTDASGQQTLEFYNAMTLTTPAEDAGINLVVMKGDGNNVVVYMWGSDAGQTQWPPVGDSDVALTFGDTQTISAVSFCHGLGLEPPPVVEELPPLPLCADSGDADACESGEAFECDLTGAEVSCCCCDEAECDVCDPSILDPEDPNFCTPFTFEDRNIIQMFEGSTCICYKTSRGERCYGCR